VSATVCRLILFQSLNNGWVNIKLIVLVMVNKERAWDKFGNWRRIFIRIQGVETGA